MLSTIFEVIVLMSSEARSADARLPEDMGHYSLIPEGASIRWSGLSVMCLTLRN